MYKKGITNEVVIIRELINKFKKQNKKYNIDTKIKDQ
jgi:hypothetical protein